MPIYVVVLSALATVVSLVALALGVQGPEVVLAGGTIPLCGVLYLLAPRRKR